jgi:uncharacterized phage-associated protein
MKTAQEIAEYCIYYFSAKNEPITNLKLQKILYYVQAWHLVYFDKDPLFPDEPEAWANGPVYRSVYNVYKKYSVNIIKVDSNPETIDKELSEMGKKLALTKRQLQLINDVLNKYGSIPTFSLVHLTHSEGPWNNARRGIREFQSSSNPIHHSDMFAYYSNQLKEWQA